MARELMSCQVEDAGGEPAKATVTFSGVGALHEWLGLRLNQQQAVDSQALTPLAADADQLRSEHEGLWLGLIVEEVPIVLGELTAHMTWVLRTQAPEEIPTDRAPDTRRIAPET